MLPPYELVERLRKAGQGHLLTFWNDLDGEQQQAFIADIESADIEKTNKIYEEVRMTNQTDQQTEDFDFLPPTATSWSNSETCSKESSVPCTVTVKTDVCERIRESWKIRGLQLIVDGKVGALILAGGQGTRLGCNGPKGTFPIGAISKKSLFQIFCERHIAIRRIAQKFFDKTDFPRAPLYVMTSEQNHHETVQCFKENQYFGLNEADVLFFSQQSVPCYSPAGLILLEEKGKIARNPNGNGGVFRALQESGMMENLRSRGIEGLHVFGVDNALVKVLDPTFIGYVLASGAQVGNKCVIKTNPDEKLGVMCLRRQKRNCDDPLRVCVLEYSDIPSELRDRRVHSSDPNKGPLLLNVGNIANHFFHVDFIEHLQKLHNIRNSCPPHVAYKKIVHIDIVTGHRVTVDNGIKFEYFIFDSFVWSNHVACFLVPRESEFAPVKNMEGDDSPLSCRALMSCLYKEWLSSSGCHLHGDGYLEISPLVSYEGEALESRTSVMLPDYICGTQ